MIRILAGILGILTIAVTLFLFLYIFWKGKNVMSLSFILDKPAGVPLGTAGGIYPALMGSIYLGALSALMGGIIGIGVAVYLVFYCYRLPSFGRCRKSLSGGCPPTPMLWIYYRWCSLCVYTNVR